MYAKRFARGLKALMLSSLATLGVLSTAHAVTCPNAIAIPATTLPATGSVVCGTTDDITQTNAPGWGTYSGFYLTGFEALYTFTPTVTASYNVTLNTPTTWTSVWVFNGCPTTAGTQAIGAFASTVGGTKTATANLVAGTTYYIMFDTWPSPASPCATSPSTYTIDLTPAAVPASCATLVAPANAATVGTSPTLSWDPVANAGAYQVYIGATAATATLVATVQNTVYVVSPALAIGTYSWYVVPTNSTGAATGCSTNARTFTTTNPPANDNCAGAVTMTVSPTVACGTSSTGTTIGATQSPETAPTCGATGVDDDVWYKFVATSTAHRINITNVTGAVTDMAMSIYSGACGSLTHIQCSDPNTMDVTGLTVGQTYYVRVWTITATSGSSATSFNICVATLPTTAPANDNCAGAVTLTVNPTFTCTAVTSGYTNLATQSTETAPTCGATGVNDDVWYKFVATNASQRISLTNVAGGTTDMAMSIYSGACGSLTHIQCSDPETMNVTGLTVGQTYYVRVWTWSSTATINATFDICVGTPPTAPANDNCAGAVTLTVNPTFTCTAVTSGTTVSATQSTETAPTCGATGVNDDVWYKFVATSTGHRISLTNVTGGTTDMAMSIYSGACGSLTHIQCSDPETMNVTGLTVGQTYYVRVWTWSSTVGTDASFNICVGTPPPPPVNDNCSGAISIATVANAAACGTGISVVTTGATQSTTNPITCTTTGNNDDVWYSFTATANNVVVRFNNMVATDGTATTMGLALHTGTCAAPTQFICNSGFGSAGSGRLVINNLTVGTTYLMNVFAGGASNAATFNMCVYDTVICAVPLSLTATAPTTTGATLGWTQPPTGNNWQIQYGVGAFTLGTGTSVTTNQNPYVLGGLTPGTTYSYFVRNICGPGDTSLWSTRFTFNTVCVASALPFLENFSTTTFPPTICWSRATGLLTTNSTLTSVTSNNWVSDDYMNVTTPVNRAARNNVYQSGNRHWLISPSIDLGSTTPSNYIVEFNMGVTDFADTFLDTLGTDDTVAAVVSYDNGATWNIANALRIWTFADDTIGSQRYYFPITASGQIKIGFYTSDGVLDETPDNDVFFDSLRVSQCNPIPVALGPDTTVCGSGAFAITLNAGPGNSYIWSTGATTQTISVTTPGSYSVTVATGSAACLRSDTVSVTTGVFPVVNLGPDTSVCGNVLSFQLNAGNPLSNYVWSSPATDLSTFSTQIIDLGPIINAGNIANSGAASNTAPVIAAVTNPSGCTGRDTVNVSVIFTARVSDFTITGTDPTFVFTPVLDSFANIYAWSFGDGGTSSDDTATHTYATNGSYTVTLMVGNQCGMTDTVTKTRQVTNDVKDVTADGTTITLYPNPTAADAVLAVDGNAKLRGYQVLNAAGAVVAERTLDGATRTTLNTNAFAPGIYTLRIQLDKGVVVRKLEVIK